jgi:Type IIA topoisomerase (DNA gyrase/topo II, topoisomerase IV), B subunit
MGCGVELGGKQYTELDTFKLEYLGFFKIVFCSDANVYGYLIRSLVLTMLYRLYPHPDLLGLCVFGTVAFV